MNVKERNSPLAKMAWRAREEISIDDVVSTRARPHSLRSSVCQSERSVNEALLLTIYVSTPMDVQSPANAFAQRP